MKKIIIITLLFAFSNSFAQNESAGSWSFGAGASNSIMHGDLRTSFKLDKTKTGILNLGGYAYIDKMFSPAFGFELKGRYTKMSGGAFELSSYEEFLSGANLEDLRFESTSMDFEFTTIFNLSSLRAVPFSTKERKWNFATYAGLGWHQYKPVTYNIHTDAEVLDLDLMTPNSYGQPNSIYFTGAVSLKYKLSNNLDIELRQDFNIDEDDNLDGAKSFKKGYDFFFNTGLGIVYKFNHREDSNYIWIDETPLQEVIAAVVPELRLVDTDGDGVIDQFDKEPNTFKGALVYGNGVTIDTDKDGFPDYTDPCPLRYSKVNKGCPLDTDGDGIADDMDLCPTVKGDRTNSGCPTKDASVTEVVKPAFQVISVEPVFFDLNLYNVKKEYHAIITKAALTLLQNPGVRLALEGHADVRGDNSYNQTLSENRVNAVKEALITRGVDEKSISTEGFGENNPAFKNSNYNSYNRRVDIILIK